MSMRYPGDTQDALFMNDGDPWWVSPDLWINAPNGTVATPGANTVFVRVSTAANTTFEASRARAQVFVGNPSLVMTPTAGTVPIGSVIIPKSEFGAGGAVTRTLPWTVTVDSANPGGPDQPGHRCLIARVFPFGSPVPADFDVPGDQHEAQRNIVIAIAAMSGPTPGGAGGGMAGAAGHGKPLGPGEDGLWEFRIDTTLPPVEELEAVLIGAGPPTRIPQELFGIVRKQLGDLPFENFAKPARQLLLDFDVPDEDLPSSIDGRPWRPEVGAPRFDKRRRRTQVKVLLEPERVARFALKVDLGETPVGQAQILEVEQTDAGGRSQGGLTVILHRVG